MAERREKMSNMRKLIGKNLMDNQNNIPWVSGSCKIDMTDLLAMQKRLEEEGRKISMTPFLLKALCMALKEVPVLNTRWEGEEMIWYDNINPGIAVDSPNGLMVLVLKDLQDKTLYEIDEAFRELMGRVKTNKLSMDDMTGGTVTFSNVTKSSFNFCTSINNNHECMISALCGIFKEPMVMKDGSIAARDVATLTVNTNHAMVDAGPGNLYFQHMKQYLEEPEKYLL